jgi:hypothetical protein
MIHGNEIVLLLLGISVLIFVYNNRRRLQRLPAVETLLMAFYTLIVGWLLTNVEGLFWSEGLNTLEHLCYAASSVLTLVWCWRVFGPAGEES